MRSLEEASRCEKCRNFDHEAINFGSITTSRSRSFKVLNNASCLTDLLLRGSEKSSWLEGRKALFAGGCNEDRRLSGIWRALLAYNDGSGGSRHGRGRAHDRCPVTARAWP